MSRLKPVSIESSPAHTVLRMRVPRPRTAGAGTWFVVALATVPMLAGCGLFGGRSKQCRERQGYEDAQTVPPLKSADGSPVQATRNALKIPEVSQTAKERSSTEPCLDEPPSFYPGRPKPGQAGAKSDAKSETKPAAVTEPSAEPKPN